jgi:hypothetical protein
MTARPVFTPPLEPDFVPAALWTRAYRRLATEPLAVALERTDGTVSRYDTRVLPLTAANTALNRRHIERLLKTLLWARGGWKVIIGGDPAIVEMIGAIYSSTGERKFDHEFMGAKVYGREFTVETRALEDVPAAKETAIALGRHLDGCRIGFDLGGSDRKCAAVIDGQCVFSGGGRLGSLFPKRSAVSLRRDQRHLAPGRGASAPGGRDRRQFGRRVCRQ